MEQNKLEQQPEPAVTKQSGARFKSIVSRILCGIALGIGGVLPGVSGGILAISLGIYEKMMLAIGTLFQQFKQNFRYLFPLGVGVVIGILLGSNILSLLITQYEAQLIALFTGLVLGSLPELFSQVRLGGTKLKPKHIVAAALGLGVVLLFAIGEHTVVGNTVVSELSIPGALLAGAVLSIGTVIPGISSSFILVYLGLYSAVIATIASALDIKTLATSGLLAAISKLGAHLLPLIVMAGAFALVSFGIIKLVNRMLRRHHATSYAAIIGFVLGSVALVVPNIVPKVTWDCALFLVAGLALSLLQYRTKSLLEQKVNKS